MKVSECRMGILILILIWWLEELLIERDVSIDVAAARVGLFGLLVEVDGGGVQVVALGHQVIHGFSAFKQVLQVLMHDILHFLQLPFDAQ